MRNVSGSRPDGVQDKKRKKENSTRSLGNMEEIMGGNEVGKQRIGEKKRAMLRARARNQILFYLYGK